MRATLPSNLIMVVRCWGIVDCCLTQGKTIGHDMRKTKDYQPFVDTC